MHGRRRGDNVISKRLMKLKRAAVANYTSPVASCCVSVVGFSQASQRAGGQFVK